MIKRLPAKKIRIVDIANGKYFPGNKEEMKPSYVITAFGEKVSRVNLVASVMDKFLSEDGNYSTMTIDDGSESLRVKAFKEDVKLLEDIEVGDMVLVIGKLKEYNGEVYINAEVVKKVNPNYESLRKLEILEKLINQEKVVEEIKRFSGRMSQEELNEFARQRYGLDGESVQAILEGKIDYKPKF